MRRSRGALCAAAIVVAAASAMPAALAEDGLDGAAAVQRLFHIERSKNENIVAYDARIDHAGRLDAQTPVEAYWILAEDGARHALSSLQRRFAYGYKAEFASPEVVVLRLAADIGREIKVERIGDLFRAIIDIDGKRAVLDHIYVESIERKLRLPSVEFVDLFGFDPDTGAEFHERIVP